MFNPITIGAGLLVAVKLWDVWQAKTNAAKLRDDAESLRNGGAADRGPLPAAGSGSGSATTRIAEAGEGGRSATPSSAEATVASSTRSRVNVANDEPETLAGAAEGAAQTDEGVPFVALPMPDDAPADAADRGIVYGRAVSTIIGAHGGTIAEGDYGYIAFDAEGKVYVKTRCKRDSECSKGRRCRGGFCQ
jgi:hypothetical protein